MLAKGTDPGRLLAEDGGPHGWRRPEAGAGSLPPVGTSAVGVFGCTGTVGPRGRRSPRAAAWGARAARETDRIAIAIFRRRGGEPGARLLESFNLAFPVAERRWVFVCENNQYAHHLAGRPGRRRLDLPPGPAAFGITAAQLRTAMGPRTSCTRRPRRLSPGRARRGAVVP